MDSRDEDSSDEFRAGRLIADKFVVQGVIGSGGMGRILRAEHVKLGQLVAIKVLTESAARDPTSSARFLREAQHAARLRSEHVARVHDVGTLEGGQPYIVMELLEGEDLACLLRSRGLLGIGEAVEYVAQALDAVDEAHRAGIVHRDLKPANLFLAKRSNGSQCIKVLDFGISKTREPVGEITLTAASVVVGSPLYMSPEQVRDAHTVDARSDIWSLGMILYELLGGVPAFRAQTLTGLCAAITADDPLPLTELRPEVSAELAAVVHRCLKKDPAQRFEHARNLLRALEPFRRADDLGPTRRSPGGLPATERAPEPEEARPETSTLRSATRSVPTRARAKPRAGWLLAFGAVALGGTLLVLVRERAAPPLVAEERTLPATAAPLEKSFALTIDSSPQGARVREGSKLLGSTPLELQVDNLRAARASLELTLELDGYRPHVLVQGPSATSVRVLLPLVPEPATPPRGSAPVKASVVAKPEARPRSKEPEASARDAELDIRTER